MRQMISTGVPHGMKTVTSKSGTVKEKPGTVVLYNRLAKGIDLADMSMQYYHLTKKTAKW